MQPQEILSNLRNKAEKSKVETLLLYFADRLSQLEGDVVVEIGSEVEVSITGEKNPVLVNVYKDGKFERSTFKPRKALAEFLGFDL